MTDDNVIDIKKQKKELERQADLTEEKYYKHFEGWKIRKTELRVEDIPGMDKFNLNERLIFTVIGPKNTQVDVILRFD